MSWLVGILAVLVVVYVALIALIVAGSRQWDVRMIARLVPYCAILFKRLLGDPRVPSRWKVASGLALIYLALPIDLVPDFIPVAGQLDDAIIVAAALRTVVRHADPQLLREHWAGSDQSFGLLLRLAGSR
jgi:uncharacterized membrane protein YkvA (DUF1232 family)